MLHRGILGKGIGGGKDFGFFIATYMEGCRLFRHFSSFRNTCLWAHEHGYACAFTSIPFYWICVLLTLPVDGALPINE